MHKYVETLLQGEQVEWKTLGEVCDYEQPTKYLVKSKEYNDDYTIPVLTAGKTFILGYTNELTGIYKASKNPCIIFDDFTTANKWVDFDFKAKSSAMKMITSKNENVVLLKFIFYWINTLPDIGEATDHKRQWISTFSVLPFPIPPLPVQEKIVDILDKLCKLKNALKNALKNERALRLKQYSYYRNKLLRFGDEVEWKSLSEVGEIIRGNGLTKKDLINEGFPAIHYGQIYTYYKTVAKETISFVSIETADKLKKVNYGDVIITNTSENLEDVCKSLVYLGKEVAVTGGHASIFKPSSKILGKFFAYYTQTAMFFEFKRKLAKGTKVIDVSANDLKTIKIPIPPLEKQQEIVNILDKFDKLTNDITEGLPKEIELREKQYQYYRDLLLSFE